MDHKCFYRFEQRFRYGSMLLFKCASCGNRYSRPAPEYWDAWARI